MDWPTSYKVFFALGISAVLLSLTRFLFKNVTASLRALETGLLNLKDGEFSTTLSVTQYDELGRMCELYNQTVDKLRVEKHWIYQRELLLDKIIQSSPDVLFLVNDQGQIVFSNVSARHFFKIGVGMEGRKMDSLFDNSPKGVQEAVEAGKEGLFSLSNEQNEAETWHMTIGTFLLNNQSHKLFILKQMTKELSRQEVAVWKKVIRVISHELNNSIGPISSMLHSGRILSKNTNEDRLNRVFDTIDERMQRLSEFVQGYGKFAKIPEPKIKQIVVSDFFAKLSQQWQFSLLNDNVLYIDADPMQLEQMLINLLKNAHESETKPEHVDVAISHSNNSVNIIVSDRGKGIAESRLSSVLIPFYSTKASGSGLGLALCREISEAHHGNIALYNRDEGGVSVRISLPILNRASVLSNNSL